MPKITFIDHAGMSREIDAKAGASLMETAVQNAVPGIDADCGGACACATCHVFVEAPWMEKVGHPEDMEKSMLDFADGVQPNSRLSCQILVTNELDGLVVRTPASQG